MTVPTIAELKRSLLLQPPHSCCDDAVYLRPPTRGTSGEYVRVHSYGRAIDVRSPTQFRIGARDEWTFDIGDGGHAPVIKFCPFCGEELLR